MKRPLLHSKLPKLASFTLVELLVVIGIIGILAAVLFSAGGTAINAAKRAQAGNLANQINTSVLNYYTEYSVYPIPSTTTTDANALYGTNDATDWQPLIYALCGNINPATGTTPTGTIAVSNTRAITFLNLRKSDVNSTNGVPVTPIGPTGNGSSYFNIAMDADYNGILSNLPASTSPTSLTNIVATGVAVWANCNANSSSTNANFWVRAGF